MKREYTLPLSKAVRQTHSCLMKMPSESHHMLVCMCSLLTVHNEYDHIQLGEQQQDTESEHCTVTTALHILIHTHQY